MIFILSALWRSRIRGLWKLPDQRVWLLGKLSLVLMGGAMLSKYLSNFLLMGGAVFPTCCLTWGQTMVEVMKITVTSFKRSHACTVTLSAHDPAAGHGWPMPLPETSGHPEASLGQSLAGSLLLSPESWCTQVSVWALQESVSPGLCKFWQVYVGLMMISSKRAYAIPKSAITRASAPIAGHCWPIPMQETLKHSKASLAKSLLGLLEHIRFFLSPLRITDAYGI